jgi:ribosomal protein S18 acetylase RimI-like enzyme
MIVREATLHDLTELSKLFDAYRVHYKQQSDIPAAEIFLHDRMQRKESVIFVAEEGMCLLGFTQLYPVFSSVGMKRAWILNDLFVDASARNKGVATALLDAGKEMGKQTNSRYLLLQTNADNFTAQKLYEKYGWIKESDLYYSLPLDK